MWQFGEYEEWVESEASVLVSALWHLQMTCDVRRGDPNTAEAAGRGTERALTRRELRASPTSKHKVVGYLKYTVLPLSLPCWVVNMVLGRCK